LACLEKYSKKKGVTESKDKPRKPEIEGEKKTSSEGAHRPDKGVKFIEMKFDDQFKTKANYQTLRP
jgi:hypothetical protein